MTSLEAFLTDWFARHLPQLSGRETVAERLAEAIEAEFALNRERAA